MLGLTYNQLTTLVGCVLAIALGTVDTWFFNHAFSGSVDLFLISAGIGGLLGVSLPTVARVPNTLGNK